MKKTTAAILCLMLALSITACGKHEVPPDADLNATFRECWSGSITSVFTEGGGEDIAECITLEIKDHDAMTFTIVEDTEFLRASYDNGELGETEEITKEDIFAGAFAEIKCESRQNSGYHPIIKITVFDGTVVSPTRTEPMRLPVLDMADLDIDGDGVTEKCVATFGPTSGLFTVILTASADGVVKYRNAFNLIHGELFFGEKDGKAQFIMDGEYHNLFVQDNCIMIDNLDPKYEGYWGGAEWNYNLR